MLILHCCDPVGTTMNWTFSCDRFRCKNFESGRLVWIPNYFGTLFCRFSTPVIQWALLWIEPSFVIGSVAKILSLVSLLAFHVILGPCFVDSSLLWSNGHYKEFNLQLWSVPLQNFESGSLVWIPRYFGTLFCWFSTLVIQWALQWIETSVVIGSLAKFLNLVGLFGFHIIWDTVLLILHICVPVGTSVNWTFSCDRFSCKNFDSGRFVWNPRYFGTLFCWFSTLVIQWALQWIETSVVIGSLAKFLNLVGLFGFHIIWDPVLLMIHSCDPVGTTVNWTFSCDRFCCKNFESGRLVGIPRYFGTMFCWFSAPVIQWALQRI